MKTKKNKEGTRMYGDLILWKQIIAKSKVDKKPIVLVTDERKTDWWWKIKDGRNMGPRQELVEEMMTETGMDFHMYSSERFLSYGQIYLDENVNKEAIEELQAMKMAELEAIRRKQLKAEREKRVHFESLDRRNVIQMKLQELKEKTYSIERQKKDLELEAQDNPEAQEYIHRLNIQKAELQDEQANLVQQLEKWLLREEIIRHREKKYDELIIQKLRKKDE